MMRWLSVFFLFFLVTPELPADEGKEIFEKKCGNCHTLERALNKTKSLEAWKRTTKRMSSYANSGISRGEAEKVAHYLASRQEKAAAPAVREAEEVRHVAEVEDHDMFDFKKVRVEQFIDPSVCAECHGEIYEQWKGSMHSKAFADPLWRAASKLFFKEATSSGELLEMKACVKCHTPLGFRSYSITSPEDDYDKLADLPAQGIFCNWCHNISEVKHLGDARYEVEPGGGEDDPSIMLGPRKDADSPYHPTKYSELHTRSEFCALCHNVSHAANNLPLELTYDEWKNSPYNTGDPATTVHCQDCHMRQRPGIPVTGKTERPDNPGKACDMGPDRPHIWTHYFVGANAVVTRLLGSEKHAQMAVERLQHAADLEIIKNSTYEKNALAQVRVKVINSGAGHYLPTGLTEVRQMWLEVKVTDAKGRVLLHSGALNDAGDIDSNAVIYYTQLGNARGEPVLNVALADRIIFDHRIPPKGYALERYAFYIPEDAAAPLQVTATLNYRSAAQSLVNTLLGEAAITVPVIEMTQITEMIPF